jgi:hypothetical protein
MLNTVDNLPEGVTKGMAIQEAIAETEEEMKSLGWEAETRMGVHFAALQGMLAKNADSLTMADINEAYGNLMIDGRPVEEVIPNYHQQLQKLYKEAKRAIYDDKYMAFAYGLWRINELEIEEYQRAQNRSQHRRLIFFTGGR